jgi:NAD(P)-dependent dehydrogenase (short-subunit alcohol dehydrogenase family)
VTAESLPLAGKVALVTGAGKGIGEATAVALGRAGASIVAGSRTAGDAPGSVGAVVARVRALGGQAEGVACDVRSKADVRRLFDLAVVAFGGVDVLINNAGVFYLGKPVIELTQREWDDTMEINLRGIWLCARAAVPIMKRRGGGSIVNLTSGVTEPQRDLPGMAAYAASKAGVERLTQILASELRGTNIAVNALKPSGLVTPGTIAQNPPEVVATYEPVERIGPVMVHLARCREEFTGHVVRRVDFVDGRFSTVG